MKTEPKNKHELVKPLYKPEAVKAINKPEPVRTRLSLDDTYLLIDQQSKRLENGSW